MFEVESFTKIIDQIDFKLFTSSNSPSYYVYFILFFFLCIILSFVFPIYRQQTAKVFNYKTYFTKSAKQDIFYALTNKLTTGLILILLPVLSFQNIAIFLSKEIVLFFSSQFSTGLGQVSINSTTALIIYSIGQVFFFDLGYTLFHFFSHKFPVLWYFHKVHHSATELNIITTFRNHPIDILMKYFCAGLTLGVYLGVCDIYLEPLPYAWSYMEIPVFLGFFSILQLFRHSEINIGFGYFDYIIGSPRQHFVHHHSDSKRYNSNYSGCFSFWDFVLGTIYVPKKDFIFKYGANK